MFVERECRTADIVGVFLMCVSGNVGVLLYASFVLYLYDASLYLCAQYRRFVIYLFIYLFIYLGAGIGMALSELLSLLSSLPSILQPHIPLSPPPTPALPPLRSLSSCPQTLVSFTL